MAYSHAAQLVATSLEFRRAGELIVGSFSRTIGHGDRLGLVGPNGIGKSTLLRLLAKDLEPSNGSAVVIPSSCVVGLLRQELLHGPEEHRLSLGSLIRARTGVEAAATELHRATLALSSGEPLNEKQSSRYDRALQRWLDLGGADLEHRCGDVFGQVGLGALDQDRLVGSLSGGEQAKVGLAIVLLSNFDILLLDEPTNDLDREGLEILEGFLTDIDRPFVVVSHDRKFMKTVVNGVIELDSHTHSASFFLGDWESYLHQKAVAQRREAEQFQQFESRRDHLIRQRVEVDRRMTKGIAAAKNHPDNDKSLRNARLERTEKTMSKASRLDHAMDRLEVVDKPWRRWQLQFRIGSATRSGDLVAQLDRVEVRYGEFRLGPVSLLLQAGDRLLITGPNGSGKTSLIRLLFGQSAPDRGTQRLGRSVVLGQMDQARTNLDGPGPLLEQFCDQTAARVGEARSILAKFGLGPDHVERPPSQLSPGERTRVCLAQFQQHGVNTLILDEPTNHLDLAAIEQLEEALGLFDGTLIVVSHDRAFREAIRFTRTVEMNHGSMTELSG